MPNFSFASLTVALLDWLGAHPLALVLLALVAAVIVARLVALTVDRAYDTDADDDDAVPTVEPHIVSFHNPAAKGGEWRARRKELGAVVDIADRKRGA